jgi:hypothetical protein
MTIFGTVTLAVIVNSRSASRLFTPLQKAVEHEAKNSDWVLVWKFCLIACLYLGGMPTRAQRKKTAIQPKISAKSDAVLEMASTSTEVHLQTERWWPTMSTAPFDTYTGSASCTGCHTDEGAGDLATSMQRAAIRGNDVSLPHELAAIRGNDVSLPHELAANTLVVATNSSYPPLIYKLISAEPMLEYSVANAMTQKLQPLDWVMGAGDLGQTFVYQLGDHWYQSRMSLYTSGIRLDVTTGMKVDPGANLTNALGEILMPDEVRHCFSCHTVRATTSRGFEPLHTEAGVGCEACHGPGVSHVKKETVAAAHAGVTDASIFNPAALSPADSIDFCGACHRTFDDVKMAANSANDASVVRFQPYRLEESRCWRVTQDARLTCVACHDPHQPLNRNDVSYDKNCLECHTAAQTPGITQSHPPKTCPTGATSRCISCHMPKVRVASMHGEFTDHFIRVVRQGEPFPQ